MTMSETWQSVDPGQRVALSGMHREGKCGGRVGQMGRLGQCPTPTSCSSHLAMTCPTGSDAQAVCDT